MDTNFTTTVWRQFGAAIDMLEKAVVACPDHVWSDPSKRPAWVKNDIVGFWYIVYHTLFWLDYYLTDDPNGFKPPAPFTLGELDPSGVLPDRPYTKEELRGYLEHGRRKCRAVLQAFDETEGFVMKVATRPDTNAAELLLYNMRHVQHHAAQLNLILRQRVGSDSDWVSKTETELSAGQPRRNPLPKSH